MRRAEHVAKLRRCNALTLGRQRDGAADLDAAVAMASYLPKRKCDCANHVLPGH